MDSLLDGIEEIFNADTKEVRQYVNGLRHGKMVKYKGDNRIMECEFDNNHYLGPVSVYNDFGKLTYQYYCSWDDKCHGLNTCYHDDGVTKKLECNYDNGRKRRTRAGMGSLWSASCHSCLQR